MNEKLNDALNEISDRHLQEAETYQKRSRYPYWIAAVAALLALVIGLSSLFGRAPTPTYLATFPAVPGTPTVPSDAKSVSLQSPGSLQLADLVAAPEYPQSVAYPEDPADWDAYSAWKSFRRDWVTQYALSREETQNLDSFFLRSSREFLSGEENQVYSPLNVYMALAMLAECTDGNSRQEILDLLQVDSIQVLRAQAQKIWCANYYTDGTTNSLLANSLWLDDAYSFDADTVKTLADSYFASVFHGDLGTEEIDDQLRTWLNAQTGGLLEEQAKNTSLQEETVLALASALYFTVNWSDSFSEKDNTTQVFHGTNGDYETEFMNNTLYGATYYRSSHYSAVCLGFEGYCTGQMWLILPDEGYTVQDVLASESWLTHSDWTAYENRQITLRLPKFDVSTQNYLDEGMQNLGLNDIFDSAVSDFSPICSDLPLFVSQIDHAVRVAIDEDGLTAAAYTVIAEDGTGMITPEEKISFTLDRPFLFAVTSSDDLPLFVGTVTEP